MSEKISRRGVYYDLSISPYEYHTPYGDIFKFSSKKKLEIYTRDIRKELNRIDTLIDRHSLRSFVNDELLSVLYHSMYKAFYKKIEG